MKETKQKDSLSKLQKETSKSKLMPQSSQNNIPGIKKKSINKELGKEDKQSLNYFKKYNSISSKYQNGVYSSSKSYQNTNNYYSKLLAKK